MKQNFHSFSLLFLIVFLISTTYSSTRKLATTKGVDERINNINSTKESVLKNIDCFDNLMGVEDQCGDEDEECLRRRALEEVHLDYIYTQRQRYKP